MGFADALDSEIKKRNTGQCRLAHVLDTMTDEDRQAFYIASEQVVAARQGTSTLNQHSSITASTIWRALLAEGYKVSRDSVEKHIARSCVCQVL